MAMVKTCRMRGVTRVITHPEPIARDGIVRTAQLVDEKTFKVCEVEPDYVYHHVTGLHGDQKDPRNGELKGNDNGDFFWWTQTLLKPRADGMRAFETWRGAEVLENHDDSEVFGKIPDVWANLSNKSVEMLMATSRSKAPRLVSALEKEDVTDCSMGCIVAYSFCSVPGCHRHASKENPNYTEDDWCNHLKHGKGSYLESEQVWIFEDNRDIFGVENSWITQGVGADPSAKNKMRIAEKITNAQHSGKGNPMRMSIVDLYHESR